MKRPARIEHVGFVLAAFYEGDTPSGVETPEPERVMQQFERMGFDVQAVSHVDGGYRVEVLS